MHVASHSVPVIAALGPLLAAVGLVALIFSGFAYRMGVWGLHAAFTVFGVAGWVSGIGALLSLIGLVIVAASHRGGVMLATLGLVVGALGAGIFVKWMRTAKHAVPIHDITTDLDNPPQFVAVLPLRAGAPNPATYGGAEVAALQRQGYPDVGPLTLPSDPAHVFHAARNVAGHMGWHLVAADSSAGRIEATATTRWFGFKDDIVVRLTPSGNGTRVDVRSVSRLGSSDVGTNAARIRKFLRRLRETPFPS
jgi:uncharacterized protein (DUF1499 family)